MTNKRTGDYAYTLSDVESPATQELVERLEAIDGVLKARIIK